MSNLLRSLVLSALFLLCLPAEANPGAQTVWRLLDYVAVDYPEAVQGGEVVNQLEFDEMVEFSASVRERLAALPDAGSHPELMREAEALEAAIAAKGDPAEIGVMARALAAAVLEAYPVPLAPDSVPTPAAAAPLYQQQCASCHGTEGAGDGPAGVGQDPAPIDFTDEARARERSIFALYQVIEQGLEGTTMGSYAHLPADDRWALSFHIGQYAYPADLVEPGRQLWEGSDEVRALLPDLATLIHMTPATLAAEVGEDEARALTAYLRRHPEVVQSVQEPAGLLALARERLVQGADAYAAGNQREARDLVLSAYLDGFEPMEPLLAARDAGLMAEIEEAMAELRSRIAGSADVAQVQAQADAVDALFDRAEVALAPDQASDASSFIGAFTILLREGLEALLIVIAMIAFLRKANREDAMPYVHAGWVGALLAGVVTWIAATYLVSISGASRELTEGFAALFAAVVLLFVGIWMHGKSQAGAWQRYIQEKLSHALNRRSAWFLFLLSFVVVYREVFETVLFYAALWSQGNGVAIVAGGGVAALVLVVVAWAMLRYALKLPIARFFALSSILIAVLAVVLAGKGIAALQEAGWISMSMFNGPRVDLLGLYPTLQSVGAQVLVLAVIAAGFMYNRFAEAGRPATA